MPLATTAKARPDAGRAARFSALASSTGGFRRSPAHAGHNLPLPNTPEGTIPAHKRRGSVECRLKCPPIEFRRGARHDRDGVVLSNWLAGLTEYSQ